MILPKPSVSPLPSWASRPVAVRRVPSFPEVLREIVRWLTGRQKPPTLWERFAQARLVDALAEEIEAETSLQ